MMHQGPAPVLVANGNSIDDPDPAVAALAVQPDLL